MKRYVFICLAFLAVAVNLHSQELYIGTATADITPEVPVALMGQFNLRIADTVETPLTANVIALESRNGNRSLDVAIMVSCDVIDIPDKLLKTVRDEVHSQIPEIDAEKIIMKAIHTHTAPVLENDLHIHSDIRFQKKEFCRLKNMMSSLFSGSPMQLSRHGKAVCRAVLHGG